MDMKIEHYRRRRGVGRDGRKTVVDGEPQISLQGWQVRETHLGTGDFSGAPY